MDELNEKENGYIHGERLISAVPACPLSNCELYNL